MADRIELEAVVSAANVNKYLDDLRNGVEGTAQALNKAFGGSVTKKVVIETQVDETGTKKLVAVEKERLGVADKIISLQRQSDAVQRGSLTSLRQAVNQAKQQRDGIAKYNQELGGSASRVKQISTQWQAANSRLTELSRELADIEASGVWGKLQNSFQLKGISNFLKELTNITQGLQTVTILVGQFTGAINTIVNTAADLQSLSLSFKAIGTGAAGGALALAESQRIALGLGVGLTQVQEGFRQLSPVILNTGGSLQDVSNITEALASRFAAFGISGDRARRVTNGIIQAFAKGKLQAEELTQQISEADSAFKTDFAEALNVSVEELEKLVKAGAITVDVLTKALPRLSKSSLLFGKLGPSADTAVDALRRGSVTIDQVRSNLDNLNTISLRGLTESFKPAIEGFFSIQAAVTDFFTRITKGGNLDALGQLLGSLATSASRILSSFLALAESAVLLTNAVASLVNIFTSIPGLLEAIGFAILSKFIKPVKDAVGSLRLFGNAFGSFKSYLQGIKQAFRDPSGEAARFQKTTTTAIQKVRDELGKPIPVATVSGLGEIGKQAASTALTPKATGEASVKAIKKQVKEAKKELNDLLAARERLETTKPVAPEGDAFNIAAQAKEAVTQNQEVTRSVDTVSNAYSGLSARVQNSIALIDNAAISASTLGTQLLDLENFPNIISSQIIGDLRTLADTSPAEAIRLTTGALEALKARAGAPAASADDIRVYTNAIDQLNPILDSANQRLTEVGGTSNAASRSLNQAASSVTRLTSAQNQAIQAVDNYTAAQVEYESGVRRANKSIDEQERKIKSLQKSLGKALVGQDISIDTDKAERGLNQLASSANEYTNAVIKSEIAQRIANNEAVSSIDEQIKARKRLLDIYKEAGSGKVLGSGLQDEINQTTSLKDASQSLRKEIQQLEEDRAKVINTIGAQVAQEKDLEKALEKIGESTATQAERSKALGVVQDTLIKKNRVQVEELRKLEQAEKDLQKQRDQIKTQQQARGIEIGPEAIERTNKDLKDNAKAIRDIKAAQEQLQGSIDETNGALLELNDVSTNIGQSFDRSAKATSRFGAVLRKAFGPTVGIIGKAFKGLTGLIAGAIAELGVLGAAFGAFALLQRAYNDATLETSQITEKANTAIKALDETITSLGGKTSSQTKELKGFALAYASFSLVVADIGDGIKAFAGKVSNSLAKASSSTATFTDGLSGIASGALISGLGALTGYILGVASAATASALGFAAAGSAVGPWGAAIGAVVGLIVGLASASDDGTVKLKQQERNVKTLGAALKALATTYKGLNREISKIRIERDDDGNLSVETRKKLNEALGAQELALAEVTDVYKKLAAAQKLDAQNTDLQRKSIEQLEARRKKLIAQGADKQFAGIDGPTPTSAAARELAQIDQQLLEEKKRLAELEAQQKKSTKEYEKARKVVEEITEESNRLREVLGKAKLGDDLVNSIEKALIKLKQLQQESAEFDLGKIEGFNLFRKSLNDAEALEGVIKRIARTDLQIRADITGLQQSIAENQIRISIEAGPFRDAQLLVSKITNDLDDAAVNFRAEAQALDQVDILPEEKARLLAESGLKFVAATREAKANITDAAKDFEKRLKDATSSLQGLILSKPGFFTPGEIRKNAEQIEKDFIRTLKKVRAETGDFDFFPILEGKTPEEILASKKAFVDTRNEADNLKKSIKDLTASIALLAKILIKIGKAQGIELKAEDLDADELVKSAVEGQNAVTELGKTVANFKKPAKAYGDIIGTLSNGNETLILTTDLATGEVVQLTKAQYDAAKAGKKMGDAATQGAQQVAGAARETAGFIEDASKPFVAIVGVLEAEGRKVFLIEDQFTGKIEEVTEAQLKHKKVVEDTTKAYGDLRIEASKVKAPEAPASLTPAATTGVTASQVDVSSALESDYMYDQVREAGRTAGGDWLRAVGETISKGQIFATGILGNFGNAASEYKFSLETLALAQQQAARAQAEYNTAAQEGGPNLLIAAANLERSNGALADAKVAAENAAQGYGEAALQAERLGIGIDTVKTIGQTLEDSGPKNLGEVYDEARKKVYDYYQQLQQVPEGAENLESSTGAAEGSLETADSNAGALASSLEQGAGQAQAIASAIAGIDDVTVTVRTIGTQGLWTGGPTQAGVTYRVNELGQEGFLNSAGKLTMINKPKNALWRAPSAGTVIPAHIMSSFNIPSGGVKVGAQPSMSTTTNSGVQKIAKAIQMGLAARTRPDTSMHELTAVQAGQAQQIGRLSHAIDKLNEKDWNVKVKVNASGGLHYMNALNSRL